MIWRRRRTSDPEAVDEEPQAKCTHMVGVAGHEPHQVSLNDVIARVMFWGGC